MLSVVQSKKHYLNNIFFVMKTTIIAKHVAIQIGLMLSLGAVYAAWNDDVTTSDTLTASRWNDLVSQVETLGS